MCQGECIIQFYDVDVSEVVVKPDPGNPADCPKDLITQELADELQPYYAEIGCKEANCQCIPSGSKGAFGWTPWLAYEVPAGREIVLVRKDFTTCKYAVSGTFYVSSAKADGLCMKAPKERYHYPRERNPDPRPRPKKAGEKGPEKPKKTPKKAGFKISRRRMVRLGARGGRRGSPRG